MRVPCLKDIVNTFQLECMNDNFEYFSRYPFDIKVYVFPQVWSSTALCQEMMGAYTTICTEENSGYYGVFFEDRLAYIVKNPNDYFFQDWKDERMVSVRDRTRYNMKGNK